MSFCNQALHEGFSDRCNYPNTICIKTVISSKNYRVFDNNLNIPDTLAQPNTGQEAVCDECLVIPHQRYSDGGTTRWMRWGFGKTNTWNVSKVSLSQVAYHCQNCTVFEHINHGR